VFPFKGETDAELYGRIQFRRVHIFTRHIQRGIALIYGMLTTDPEERPTVVELLTYPWFKSNLAQNFEKKHKLPEDLLEDLNTINEKHVLHHAH